MYDAELLRHANSQPSLDPVVVQTLSSSLNMHNSWIKSYKSVLLEIDNSRGTTENVGIEFAQVSRQTHGPVVGDAPPTSGKEIAALIFKDDPETRSRRFVYTFPRCGPNGTCTRPRFVFIWSPMYSSLQYPLLLFHGEPGWSSGSTKEDPPKVPRHFPSPLANHLKFGPLCANVYCAKKSFTCCPPLPKSMPAMLIPAKKTMF